MVFSFKKMIFNPLQGVKISALYPDLGRVPSAPSSGKIRVLKKEDKKQITPPLSPPPHHVALIMDGNRRWARGQGLSTLKGHIEGVQALKRTVKAAIAQRVKILSVYAFSVENWSRPALEVASLMSLLKETLQTELAEFHEAKIRLKIIGDRARLSKDLNDAIAHAETHTQHNEALTLIIALSYSAREEITQAAQKLAFQVQNGALDPQKINAALLENALSTSEIPHPDLLIRTSGEQRLSNFLLWQMAYTEFVFLKKLWPDFTEKDFTKAILQYQKRDRRYGDS